MHCTVQCTIVSACLSAINVMYVTDIERRPLDYSRNHSGNQYENSIIIVTNFQAAHCNFIKYVLAESPPLVGFTATALLRQQPFNGAPTTAIP